MMYKIKSMLVIKNSEKLKGEEVLNYRTAERYEVEGVYQYEDCYQIHLRSVHKPIVDEVLILLRNKVQNESGFTYNYYTLYDSNEPQRRQNVTKEMIRLKEMLLHSIEEILKMRN